MNCLKCQTVNDKGAKFCQNCGTPLSQESTGTLSGERRVVTILFCDIKGSTELAEDLDPEEWAELINDALKQLIESVYRYGGNVARLMGDAILAFFGAPKAHEDDPQRAIMASLDILATMREFNRQINQNENLEFQVRVGINTGLVVVADIGSDLRMEYTAMGDTVNLAARMEQTAEPGSVQITEETYRLVAAFIEATDLGEIEVKGRSKPVRAYRVIGMKPEPRSHQSLLGIQSPLVGRDFEMAQLRKVIERVHQGRGQIVCVIGEAGIGKSRLVNELHVEWLKFSNSPTEASSLDKQSIPPYSWLEAHSISYALNLPYGTFQQLVRNLCDIQPGEPPETIREKISSECLTQPTLKDKSVQFTHVFETLLGVKTDSGLSPLEGEEFKRELFAAMDSVWMERASNSPTALAFDDLHWVDQASVELLVHLFSLADEVPILFICAFRPERRAPTWDIKQTAEREYPHLYTEINLQPLDNEHSNALIHQLLTSTDLPGQLKDTILNKSEGNPYFVEQILHSLIETGVLHAEEESINGQVERKWIINGDASNISIPDTVQALLQARIDRLDEDSRQTLQKAAVIGRSFNYRVLEHLTNGKTELMRQLRTLERVDLIREEARVPEIEYVFRHALAHETVYKSILRKHRRKYHILVGEALENLYPDRLEETAPLIAHHYYMAEDSRALNYLTIAGDLAARLYANSEAIAHYDRAIDVAQKTRNYSSLEHVYIQKGRALELNAQYEQALANYSEMEALSQQIEAPDLQLASLLARATLLSTPISASDPNLARSSLVQALKLARDIGNRTAEARILWNLALVIQRFDDPLNSIDYGEQALALARELDLKELTAYTLNDLSESFMYIGEVQRARQSILEAQQIWEDIGNKPMLADSYSSAVGIHLMLGDFQKAIALSNEALTISNSINNLWGQAYSLAYIPTIYYQRGEMDKAIAVMEDCLRFAEKSGFLVPLSYTRAELALLYACLGESKIALDLVETAQSFLLSSPPAMRPLFDSYLVKIHLFNGDIDKAEVVVQEMVKTIRVENNLYSVYLFLAQANLSLHKRDYNQVYKIAEQIRNISNKGFHLFQLDELYFKGVSRLRLDNLSEAQKTLQEGRELAERLNARQFLWPILAGLVEIETQKGNLDEARTLHIQMVDVIHFIADSAGKAKPSMGIGAELRTSFLSRPEIISALNLLNQQK